MAPPHFTNRLFSRRRTARILYAVAGVATLSAVIGALVQPATAATDGSDWGSQGAIAGVDPVTVSWDNSGNAAADTVPRDATQVLPYTGGKTYADINANIAAGVATDFQNMKMTVSQTGSLTDQAVQVSITGIDGGTGVPGGSGTFVQLFQCWGSAADTAPDPTHCESGAGGSDDSTFDSSDGPVGSGIFGDPALLQGGDLKAVTQLTLDNANAHNQSTLVGTTATLRAELTAQGRAATGAAGTVDFTNSQGDVIARNVPVVDGVATTTVRGVSAADPQTFGANYTATATENYTSSSASPITLPTAPDVQGLGALLPGATYALDFGVDTFGDSDPVTVSLDSTPLATGTTTAFGGLDANVSLPATLATGTHTLEVVDAKASDTKTLTFTTAAAFAAPTTGLGTNSDPDQADFMAFNAIDGGWATVDKASANSYFGQTTTNEVADFVAPASSTATGTHPFQMQATDQSAGLGCGLETGQPSTSSCWLVAVPRGYSGDSEVKDTPLSPSLWANRLQVKLGFADIPTSCAGTQSRTLTVGSETLSRAISSWTPALCSTDGVALGYSTVTDPTARSEYSSGTSQMIFTSGPVDDSGGATETVYAPVAVTGVTIAVHVTDASSSLVSGIKLNARLVAKLLTESYSVDIDNAPGSQVGDKAPWSSTEITSLFNDPEFQKLNPGFVAPSSAGLLADIVVSGGQSDATTLLWSWLAGDPESKAFLDGCPDTDSGNSVINPFYSTRTYAECPTEKNALDATAQAEIAETKTPPNFTYQTPSYPPADGTFPQPQYYARDAITTGGPYVEETALGLGDLHPQETSMEAVGQDIFRNLEKTNSLWCVEAFDSDCTSGPGTPGEWTSGTAASWGSNASLGLTQSSTSASYQETTVLLCDDDDNCVGADTKSLQQAATDFGDTSTPGFQESKLLTGALDSDQLPSDESDGAYPLTLPVYAEVNTKNLLAADAKTYAKVIDYATTTGQTPGLTRGQLPPGYAPLNSAQVAQAQETVKTLDDITDPTTPGSTPPPAPSGSGVTGPGAGGPAGSPGPATGTTPADNTAPAGNAAPAVSTGGSPAAPVVLATSAVTSKTAIGFPQYGVVGGLSVGLLAGVAAPIIGRTRKGERR